MYLDFFLSSVQKEKPLRKLFSHSIGGLIPSQNAALLRNMMWFLFQLNFYSKANVCNQLINSKIFSSVHVKAIYRINSNIIESMFLSISTNFREVFVLLTSNPNEIENPLKSCIGKTAYYGNHLEGESTLYIFSEYYSSLN